MPVIKEFWWGSKGCSSNLHNHGVRWGAYCCASLHLILFLPCERKSASCLQRAFGGLCRAVQISGTPDVAGRMMSKLNYWRQTDYTRLLHIDSDAVITGDVDAAANGQLAV